MVKLTIFSANLLAWAIITSTRQVAAYVSVVNIREGAHGYTKTCIQALKRPVNCHQSLLWADGANNYYDGDTIASICTASCKRSLDAYIERVKAACDTSRYNSADGLSYHGGYGAQQAWERFDYLCMNNSAGDNCNLVMGKLAGVNPKNQQATAPAAPNLNCNECALSGIKKQLEMPLASGLRADPAIASMISSIASSCKTTISITAAPSASPPWVMLTAPPSPTSTRPEPMTSIDNVVTPSLAPIPMVNIYTAISVIRLGGEDEL